MDHNSVSITPILSYLFSFMPGILLYKELIDADPQGSLTASLGYQEPDDIRVTLATIMTCIINEEDFPPDYGILHHEENIDLLPANIELSGLEVSLSNTMSREMILRDYIEQIRELYEYILIDCMPSLGVMTINALAAADRVLIPVQAAYLPVKGLQQLIRTVNVVKKRLNKNLMIEGILINMVDYRTNYAKDITEMLHENYGDTVGILDMYIPFSVKIAELSFFSMKWAKSDESPYIVTKFGKM